MVNVSDHTKCISLNNQSCLARPTAIDLTLIWVGFLGVRFEVGQG